MQNKTKRGLKLSLAGVLGCGILASSAFGAEKEGAFAGVEFGLTSTKFKQNISMNGMGSNDIKADGFLPSIAIKGGYKWFFTKDFGVRAYGQVGVGHNKLENVKYSSGALDGMAMQAGGTKSVFVGTKHTYYTTFIDYFVGADVLYNFINTKSVIWGAYAGVGVGAVTWVANGKEFEPKPGTRSYINFAANANLGLRATIKDKHGVELGARVYFPGSEIFKASNATQNNIPISDTKTTHDRPFSIVLGYSYSF